MDEGKWGVWCTPKPGGVHYGLPPVWAPFHTAGAKGNFGLRGDAESAAVEVAKMCPAWDCRVAPYTDGSPPDCARVTPPNDKTPNRTVTRTDVPDCTQTSTYHAAIWARALFLTDPRVEEIARRRVVDEGRGIDLAKALDRVWEMGAKDEIAFPMNVSPVTKTERERSGDDAKYTCHRRSKRDPEAQRIRAEWEARTKAAVEIVRRK